MSSTTSSHVSLTKAKRPQEEDINEECKDLISTLPKEKGWIFTNLYKYEGFWFTSTQLQGILTCQQQFEAENKDILLITSPKCGTTWLKALLFAVVNRANMAPSAQNHPLLSSNPHDLVPFLEIDVYFDQQLLDISKFSSPRVFSTHIPLGLLPKSIKDSSCKIVYLCRNPKDTFISLWHFANKFRTQEMGKIKLEEAFDKFINGETVNGPFWDHVLEYWNYSLDRHEKVMFLKFEDLQEHPKLHLKKLAEFCDYPFSFEEENEGVIEKIIELCSFRNLSNLEVNTTGNLYVGVNGNVFFRKGGVGDWVNFFNSKMTEQFDSITKEKFGPSGLLF